MTDTEGTAAKHRVDVAFLRCFDATVFAEPVMMTDAEEERLHAPLGSPGAYMQRHHLARIAAPTLRCEACAHAGVLQAPWPEAARLLQTGARRR